jgi:hypothetical protein
MFNQLTMKPNWNRLRHPPSLRYGTTSYGVAGGCKIAGNNGAEGTRRIEREMRNQWTVGTGSCSVWPMWKTLVALIICATPALAQEQFTAYDALRVLGVHLNRDAVNHVVSVTGTRGSPQPKVWRILIADRGGVREVQVRNGQVVSDRPSSAVGSTEGSTINTARLNLDSSGAFQVASHIADKSGTRFDSASYTLRTDQHGDPVWIVTLHGVGGEPVGTIHIGANRGTVTRTEGMFAGATMNDVATEQRVYREERHHDDNQPEVTEEQQQGRQGGDDDEHGPLYGVRQKMRGYFHRAQDEAADMFQRVRQSFNDSVNR